MILFGFKKRSNSLAPLCNVIEHLDENLSKALGWPYTRLEPLTVVCGCTCFHVTIVVLMVLNRKCDEDTTS